MGTKNSGNVDWCNSEVLTVWHLLRYAILPELATIVPDE